MTAPRRRTLGRLLAGLIAAAAALLALSSSLPTAASAASSTPVSRLSGDGSSWAGNALQNWVTAVKAQGVTVDFNPDGSSLGRDHFAAGLSDFAVSEIPYTGDTSDPQDSSRPNFGYAMLPVVAGGTSFMYNLSVGGNRFTNLKLSDLALAKIFSGQITQWNDPAIAKTNPGVALPAQRITVVVRSDGSGATAEFTLWMLHQFPQEYAALCAKAGCNPHSATSYFPTQNMTNFTAQSGSNGVTTYTANTPYTINYDEYSYALGVNFPVAQVQNAAGYFTVPSADAVAVALTQAKINTDKSSPDYLSQDLSNVYGYKDPRTYPISAYSYMIEPTVTHGNFDTGKGQTLSYFETFSLCDGQQSMSALGYSPLPMNLVLDAMDQVERVPGLDPSAKTTISQTKSGVKSGKSNPCNNPTFRPGDNPAHNILTDNAPFPSGCDSACQAPWARHSSDGGDGGSGSPTSPSSPGTTSSTTTNPATGGNDGQGSGDTGDTTDPNNPGDPGSSTGVVCDADTGVCGGTDGQTTTGTTTAVASPMVLDGNKTWGSTQVALLISALLAALLLFVPPLAAQLLGGRRRPGSPASRVGRGPDDPDGEAR